MKARKVFHALMSSKGYTDDDFKIEQEPVAWINAEKRTFEWNGPVLWNTPTVAVLNKILLYTHPPQRKVHP
jgi:hypothetical protein